MSEQIDKTDSEIDRMVYELYGLSEVDLQQKFGHLFGVLSLK